MATIVPVNFEVNELSEGNYEVKQVEEPQQPQLNSGNRKDFSFNIEICKFEGYYDPDTQEIAVNPYLLGMKIGDGYYASLSKGLQIQIALLAYNGGVKFYREGNSIMCALNLKPLLPWGDNVQWTGEIMKV